MSRFVNVNGRYINTDLVRSFHIMEDGTLRAVLFNDFVSVPGSKVEEAIRDLRGERHIIQVFPTAQPLYAVYKAEGEYFAELVSYLALCADGEIRGLEWREGWFDIISENENCEGLYPEDQLAQFPGIETGAGGSTLSENTES